MKTTQRLILGTIIVFAGQPVAALPGDLDTSFGSAGVVTTSFGTGDDVVTSMALQSDGKVVVVGYAGSGNGLDFALVRYHPDGTLDTTFNGTGKVITDFRGYGDVANGVTLQSDGKILVAGYSSTNTRYDIAIARYNNDGSLDTSFGAAGNGKVVTAGIGTTSTANAVTVQADGKILIAGHAGFDYNNRLDFAVARFLVDGTLDNSFGTGGLVTSSLRTDHSLNEYATSIALQADGKILVAGAGAVYNGSVPYFVAVVRYNADGTTDSGFSGPGQPGVNGAGHFGTHYGYASGMALQPDGKIVLAGSNFNEPRQYFTLDRYSTSGSQEISQYTGIGVSNDSAYGLALQGDGKIVLAGYASNANSGVKDFALVRYLANGSLDTSFNATGKVTTAVGAGNAICKSIVTRPDGRIIVAGESSNGTKKVFTVARYFAFGSLVTSAPVNGSITNNTTPVISGTADANATIQVYVDAVNVGSAVANSAGAWIFTPASALAEGLHSVNSVDAADITATFSNTSTFTVDTVAPAAPVVLTPANGTFTNNTRPFISGTAEAGAVVTIYLDEIVSGTATASGIGAWSYSPVATLIDGQHTVKAKATDRAGNAGVFSSFNTFISSSTTAGTPGDLDISFGNAGTVTTSIGSGNDDLTSMVMQSDGKIVVAGYSNSGSNLDFAVARYLPNGTLDTTFNGTGKATIDFRGYGDAAYGVTLQSDGKILVVGNSSTNTRYDIAIARFNSDGTLDNSFGSTGNGKVVTAGIGTTSTAYAVTVQADGKIVIVGHAGFDYNNRLDFAVARYLPDGTLDNSFGTGGLVTTSLRSDYVLNDYATSIVLQSDGKILVAGAGPVYNGSVPYYVAVVRYNTDGTRDNSFTGPNFNGSVRTHNGYATAMALQPDGKVVLSGANFSDPRQYFTLDRYTTGGDHELSQYTGIGIADDAAYGVALQSDGKIVLAGYSYNANTAFKDFALVRYLANGNVDTSFHSSGKVTTHIGTGHAIGKSVAIQPDGRIVVAGESSNGTKKVFTVARYFGAQQPPIVQTGAAASISKTAASLNATVNPNSLETAAHFEYGLTTSYGSVSGDLACGSGSTPVATSAVISGLSANTTYHYRVVAVNGAALFNGTTYGADATFTTAPDPPVAITAAATTISGRGATLAGVVFPNGRPTNVHFEYGLTTAYGSTTPTQALSATGGIENVFAQVSGLVANGTYHFRVIAENSGTPLPIQGLDQSFQAQAPAPAVILSSTAPLTTTSVRLNGTVQAHNADTQVSFDYGTDGLSFPNSVSATPASLSGDMVTPVYGILVNLTPGVAYYFRLRAINAGGQSISTTGLFSLDVLSGLAQVFPTAPLPSEGFLIVNLTPAGILHGWRFVGEQQWRSSGVPVAGLTTSNREIEFRPVPGYIQPQPEPVSIVSGEAVPPFNFEYISSGTTGSGGIIVTLKPDNLTTGSGRAQWRLLGENDTQWHDSDTALSGLLPGSYLIECKPVVGRATPPNVNVTVVNSQTATSTITYFLPDAATGTPPSVLSFESITTDTSKPYAHVGQIRSNVGSSSGFVVKARVVATAAHVVWDDGTESAVQGLQWLFQRYRGVYEPEAVIPRGHYTFDGYAAQRHLDASPGDSSPHSQHLDVAAIYFNQSAGRGGYGGFLASDLTQNEFLLSNANKMLIGYPVDGISTTSQGRMHATAPFNVVFNAAYGRTFTTTGIRSSGGNSGGPLCVQFEGGAYYPAAIYLGGDNQTIVRAIDSGVIDLFNRAEVSGNGGGNNTGGGITHTSISGTTSSSTGSVQVLIEPAAARAAGAGWRLGSSGSYRVSDAVRSSVTPGSYTLNLLTVAGFDTPNPSTITVSGGQLTAVTYTYALPMSPQESWRQIYFGSPGDTGNAADAFDFDGDGFTNAQEYAAGTNPTATGDFFRAQDPVRVGNSFTLSTAGKAGRSYLLERSTTLITNSWATIATQGPLAADGTITLTDTASTGNAFFYRIRVTGPAN